jgi:hypothetical protein
MDGEPVRTIAEDAAIQALRGELIGDGGTRWHRVLEKFVMAAIGNTSRKRCMGGRAREACTRRAGR